MLNKLTTLLGITAFLALTACSDGSTDIPEKAVVEDTVKDAPEYEITKSKVQEIPEYKILEDTVKPGIKRTVEVELSSRTDEEQLRVLAEEIYALKNVDVQRTFIGYRIVGEDKNQFFWAKTDYNPDLEVKFQGKSASDYEKIKNTSLSEGEVIGSWMSGFGGDYKITVYNKDGKTHVQMMYEIDSTSDKIYELSQSDKGIKLQREGDKYEDEYLIINQKGDLEFWYDNTIDHTAPKI